MPRKKKAPSEKYGVEPFKDGENIVIARDMISIEDDFNPREDDTPDEQLLRTVEKFGVLYPITVRANPNAIGHWYVVDGARRFRAAEIKDVDVVPISILYNEDGTVVETFEALLGALISDIRKPLAPMEKARTYKRILALDSGVDEEQLGDLLGLDSRVVMSALKVLESGQEDVVKAVETEDREEKIHPMVGSRVVDIEDEDTRTQLLDQVKGESLQSGIEKVREVEEELGVVKRGRKASKWPWASDAKKRAETVYNNVMSVLKDDPSNEAALRHLELIWVLQGDREIDDLYPEAGKPPVVVARAVTKPEVDEAPKDEAPSGRKRYTKSELKALKGSKNS